MFNMADLKNGKISVQSPIGKGLLGKKKGDKAMIKVPAGDIEFEILDIDNRNQKNLTQNARNEV